MIVGYRIGQIRVVFAIPTRAIPALFAGLQHPQGNPPVHLAYVEWFTAIPLQPERHHGLYKISRSLRDGDRLASVIPVANIARSAHLFPRFGPNVPEEWRSYEVLDQARSFFINSTSDRHAYVIMT